MTPAERRAGFARLTFFAVALVLAALLFGVVLSARYGEGFAIVALGLLAASVAGWTRTGPLDRAAVGVGPRSAGDRRQAERQAAGTFALGLVFVLVALVLQ